MILYLDASVIVPLFVEDPFNDDAESIVRSWRGEVAVSDWAALEFASAVARIVRMGQLSRPDAHVAIGSFDAWRLDATTPVIIDSQDTNSAAIIIRRLDLPLRTGDAIHTAASQRIAATLATFDQKLHASAVLIGVPVSSA